MEFYAVIVFDFSNYLTINLNFYRSLIQNKKKPGGANLPASTKLLTKPTWAKSFNQFNLKWALSDHLVSFLFDHTAHESQCY